MQAEPHVTPPEQPARHDERLDGHGRMLPHWKRLHHAMEQSAPEKMQQRAEQVQRQIRENGITYNIYADPCGADRLWQLDLLPQLIDAAEWQQLAAGIAQRARLLNALLADLYGEQQLLLQGLLPAELVYGHNHYLWPCRGIQPPGGIFLHTLAVDLARGPDGQWQVIADRTQAPSGAGYALENRQILARAWPDLFRELRVQHLSPYIDTLRETLTTLAPRDAGDAPLAVLLTPGRFNETWFEHVYLSQQLGFPLVEGHDLTLRHGKVYLKTLDGLQRVHAILRRLDADFCDPLELRADSALGVPGLLDAMRNGQVLVANVPGSGVLETAGLHAFLPPIAEVLLGESLQLPAVTTWWCGEKPALQQVLPSLEKYVIKPSFPSQRFEPVIAASLGEPALAALHRRVQERPYAYVAQRRIPLSLSPVWRDGNLGLQAISLRVYAVATVDGHYHVMPGGLTRVAADDGGIVSMQRGGSSKDTWVLADGLPQGEPPRPRPLGTRDVVRQAMFLPSSLAENLFWFGRYGERCDSAARLLRAALARYIADDSAAALAIACQAADDYGLLPAEPSAGAALHAAMTDRQWPGSLTANLQRLYFAGSQVRGRLSAENWRLLGEIHTLADRLATAANNNPGDLLNQLDQLLLVLGALTGFAHDDMTRDNGWRFLMAGRHLERLHCLASAYARCLLPDAAAPASRLPRSVLDWMLEIGNSTITYRSRYLTTAQTVPVLDLLLLDTGNPRALLFQLQALAALLDTLATNLGYRSDQALAAQIRTLAAVDLAQLEQSLFGSGEAVFFLQALGKQLSQTAAACTALSDQLHLRHFAQVADVSQQTVSS